MNDTTNNQTNTQTNNVSPTISWQTKAKYIGAGLFIGVVVGPMLRNLLSQLQPKIDEVFEGITRKSEGYAEKTSDLLYKAKEHMRHSSDHHHHEKPWPKPPRSTIKEEESGQDQATT